MANIEIIGKRVQFVSERGLTLRGVVIGEDCQPIGKKHGEWAIVKIDKDCLPNIPALSDPLQPCLISNLQFIGG